jgi:hypothetical protein
VRDPQQGEKPPRLWRPPGTPPRTPPPVGESAPSHVWPPHTWPTAGEPASASDVRPPYEEDFRRSDVSHRTLGDVPQPPSTSNRLPAVTERERVHARQSPHGALIPATMATRLPATLTRAHPRRGGNRFVASAAVVATLAASLLLGIWHSLGDGAASNKPTGATQAAGTPAPSGSLPPGVWVASAGSVVYIPPPPKPSNTGSTGDASGVGLDFGIQPCHDPIIFPTVISQWTAPLGCYANVYVPNPANYPARPTFGYCNWWVRENHLSNYNITMGTQVYLGTVPAPGDAIFFDPGVQGASAEGHWAEVVAVAPDHYWFLLSEMNFAWRGAGFGRIDYRFAHVGAGVSFYK